MDDKTSTSSHIWLWIIESLASLKQVDMCLLHDLIQRTDFNLELGKNAREMVALRCLEELFSPNNEISDDCSASMGTKVGFDSSKCCEDVLHEIWHDVLASDPRTIRPKLGRRNIYPFITQKRASLPKLALQELKDTILEGSDPSIVSLREMCGLALRKQCDNQVSMENDDTSALGPRAEGGLLDAVETVKKNIVPEVSEENNRLLHDLPVEISSALKRDRDKLATEAIVLHPHDCSNTRMDNFDDLQSNAKRLKQSVSYATVDVEQNLVSSREKESLEGSVRITEKEGKEWLEEPQMVELRRDRSFPENGSCDASEKQDHSIDAKPDEFVHNEPKLPSCDNMVSEAADLSRLQQHVSNEEAQGNDHVEPMSSKDSDSDETREHGSAPSSGPHQNTVTKDGTGHALEPEASSDGDGYHNESIEITLKKNRFLSSQSTSAEDSLANLDWTEQNLCVKCSRGGDLLVCSGTCCPLAVHTNCLGSSAIFDRRGNFFCPFCAYSRAVSEYHDAKKKKSLARKALATFIGDGHHPNQGSKELPQKKQSHSRKGRDDNTGHGKSNQTRNCLYVDEANNHHLRKGKQGNQQFKPSAPCLDEGSREKMVQEPSSSTLVELQKQAQNVNGFGGDTSVYRDPQLVTRDQRCGEKPRVDLSARRNPSRRTIVVAEQTLEGENDKSSADGQQKGPVRTKDCTNINMEAFPPQEPANTGYMNTGETSEGNGNLVADAPQKPASANTNAEKTFEAEVGKSVADPPQEPGSAVDPLPQETSADRNDGTTDLPMEAACATNANNKEACQDETGKSNNLSPECGVPVSNSDEEISEDESDHFIVLRRSPRVSDHFTVQRRSPRVRKKNVHEINQKIPLLKRKKLAWTPEEVAALQEGMELFGKAEGKIPWIRILEFGSSVFLRGRTPSDLKDKWRNIMKASSKG
ncbi:hypothetical protein RJ641_026422 [Dillenia turbinata]|uniref:Myb-like domain-containing protein n=1 Tax=Dillenia turbinata TaxID=194707 RepID=A0AAN8W3D8_9MAGN